MRSARLTDEQFEPREGFDPHFLEDTRPVRVRYAKPIARYRVEKRRRAADGRIGARRRCGPAAAATGSIGEILADRGEAVVVEPEEVAAGDRQAAGPAPQRARG